MTRLTSQPSLGRKMAGAIDWAPNDDIRRRIDQYAPTGWENAPIEPMEEPSGAMGWVGSACAVALVTAAVVVMVML